MRTYHGFLSHGFPNCFHMGLTQTGLTANFTYMLEMQAKHVAQLITQVECRDAKSIEPTPEAEAEWVKIVTGAEHDDQVPERLHAGVLQRRGDKRGARASCRPCTRTARWPFTTCSPSWREQGDFEGLIVR